MKRLGLRNAAADHSDGIRIEAGFSFYNRSQSINSNTRSAALSKLGKLISLSTAQRGQQQQKSCYSKLYTMAYRFERFLMKQTAQTYVLFPTKEFESWMQSFKSKDREAVARINARLRNMSNGHFGHTRSLGDGITESKIDYGSGYRLYFTIRKLQIIVLLCGGTKSGQDADIAKAKRLVANLEID